MRTWTHGWTPFVDLPTVDRKKNQLKKTNKSGGDRFPPNHKKKSTIPSSDSMSSSSPPTTSSTESMSAAPGPSPAPVARPFPLILNSRTSSGGSLKKGGFLGIFLIILLILVAVLAVLDYTGTVPIIRIQERIATPPRVVPYGTFGRRLMIDSDDSTYMARCVDCGYAGSNLFLQQPKTAVGLRLDRVAMRMFAQNATTNTFSFIADYDDRNGMLGLFVDNDGVVRFDSSFTAAKASEAKYQWRLYEVQQTKPDVSLPRYALFSVLSDEVLNTYVTYQDAQVVGVQKSPYSQRLPFRVSEGSRQHFRLIDLPKLSTPSWFAEDAKFLVKKADDNTKYLSVFENKETELLRLSDTSDTNLRQWVLKGFVSTSQSAFVCLNGSTRFLSIREEEKTRGNRLCVRLAEYTTSTTDSTRRLIRFVDSPNTTNGSCLIEVLPNTSNGSNFLPSSSFSFGMYLTEVTDFINDVEETFFTIQSDPNTATQFLLEEIED